MLDAPLETLLFHPKKPIPKFKLYFFPSEKSFFIKTKKRKKMVSDLKPTPILGGYPKIWQVSGDCAMITNKSQK